MHLALPSNWKVAHASRLMIAGVAVAGASLFALNGADLHCSAGPAPRREAGRWGDRLDGLHHQHRVEPGEYSSPGHDRKHRADDGAYERIGPLQHADQHRP